MTRLIFALGSFETLSVKPLINETNVPGVMLSVVIHMDVLDLNELIFLAGGYSLNRHLPGKICRGAFRPSAFLIEPTWEIHAVGQVAGAQFTYCDVYGSSKATGGGRELLCMDPSRKLRSAGLL